MLCGKCGTNFEDDAEFCPNCGKSTKEDFVVVNQKNQGNGYPLSNFTANAFSVLFEIILWLIFIGGFIGGGILGNTLAGWSGDKGSYIFGGILLGGITSFIITILIGGLVSLFIKLVKNSEEIKNKLIHQFNDEEQ